MAALPAGLVPNISPAEMQILLSRAGLVLNPGQIAPMPDNRNTGATDN